MGALLAVLASMVVAVLTLVPEGSTLVGDLTKLAGGVVGGLDPGSASTGLLVGFFVGRLSGVRWGDATARFVARARIGRRSLSLLVWALALGGVLLLY